MRKAAKRDSNEPEIIDALEAAGASVAIISAAGVSDLLVLRHDRLYLLEIKSRRGKLTPAQVAFMATWPVQVVRTVDDALRAIGAID